LGRKAEETQIRNGDGVGRPMRAVNERKGCKKSKEAETAGRDEGGKRSSRKQQKKTGAAGKASQMRERSMAGGENREGKSREKVERERKEPRRERKKRMRERKRGKTKGAASIFIRRPGDADGEFAQPRVALSARGPGTFDPAREHPKFGMAHR
jgi:hypothetical protein